MQRQMEETTKELEERLSTQFLRRRSRDSDCFRKKEVVSVKLLRRLHGPDDIEMLEDLIVAATNEGVPPDGGCQRSGHGRSFTGGLGGMRRRLPF